MSISDFPTGQKLPIFQLKCGHFNGKQELRFTVFSLHVNLARTEKPSAMVIRPWDTAKPVETSQMKAFRWVGSSLRQGEAGFTAGFTD